MHFNQTANKIKNENMIYTLTGITKRSTFIYWHICCIFPDERIRYVEMRRERTDKIDYI